MIARFPRTLRIRGFIVVACQLAARWQVYSILLEIRVAPGMVMAGES